MGWFWRLYRDASNTSTEYPIGIGYRCSDTSITGLQFAALVAGAIKRVNKIAVDASNATSFL